MQAINPRGQKSVKNVRVFDGTYKESVRVAGPSCGSALVGGGVERVCGSSAKGDRGKMELVIAVYHKRES